VNARFWGAVNLPRTTTDSHSSLLCLCTRSVLGCCKTKQSTQGNKQAKHQNTTATHMQQLVSAQCRSRRRRHPVHRSRSFPRPRSQLLRHGTRRVREEPWEHLGTHRRRPASTHQRAGLCGAWRNSSGSSPRSLSDPGETLQFRTSGCLAHGAETVAPKPTQQAVACAGVHTPILACCSSRMRSSSGDQPPFLMFGSK
jgi:hypothetical protein